MNKRLPLIGITPGYDYEKRLIFIKHGYYEAVIKAGGLAFALPTGSIPTPDGDRC